MAPRNVTPGSGCWPPGSGGPTLGDGGFSCWVISETLAVSTAGGASLALVAPPLSAAAVGEGIGCMWLATWRRS